MHSKALSTPLRKPKVKPSASSAGRAKVSATALERLTERLTERMAAMVEQLNAPLRFPVAELEKAVARAAEEVALARVENVEKLLRRQLQMQTQVEQMGRLLTVQQDMLLVLMKAQPNLPELPEELSRRMQHSLVGVGDLGLRDEASALQVALPLAEPLSEATAEQSAATQSASARWTETVRRGEAARAGWVRDGLLVPSAVLSQAWNRSRQALEQACARGELFSVKVGKNRYYPEAFLGLDADVVKQVNQALKDDASEAKFIFWMRSHGALGGKTVLQALSEGKVSKVVALAEAWSEEREFADAPTT